MNFPEFSGQKGQYRSWQNQVLRRMRMIDAFKTHPKYEAALGIIRSKIRGSASNVLTNNKTAYNIIAIIDSSYADRRPLYVGEAEMTSMRKTNKTLQEFHDAINEALHLVISKIVLDYKTESEQRSLVAEAQVKAVRTFVVGLRSQMMRHILYSRTPGTLAEAFAIAQTVYYDHQYTESKEYQTGSEQRQNFSTKFKPNYSKPTQDSTQPRFINKSEPIKKNEFRRENWHQQNPQQTQKFQKINQIQNDESELLNEGRTSDEDLQNIPDDLVSNISCETTTSNMYVLCKPVNDLKKHVCTEHTCSIYLKFDSKC